MSCQIYYLFLNIWIVHVSCSEFNLDSLSDLANSLGDLISGEGCTYKCPNGAVPVPNPDHRPSSNGCGTGDFTLPRDLIPAMSGCCDTHDLCYDKCGTVKAKCDKDFKNCLTTKCKLVKEKKEKKECMNVVKLFYGGSTLLGCQPFLDAQENACLCNTLADGNKSTSNKKYKKATNAKRVEL